MIKIISLNQYTWFKTGGLHNDQAYFVSMTKYTLFNVETFKHSTRYLGNRPLMPMNHGLIINGKPNNKRLCSKKLS